MSTLVSSKKYRIVNEVLNAVTHGIGTGLSIVGLVLLLMKAAHLKSTSHMAAYAIYGSTLILLFLSSTLFHSLIFTKANKVFQVFDHSSIFLLIAGSYTPFCILTIQGKLGYSLLIAIWSLTILGIVLKSIYLTKNSGALNNIYVVIYIVMGWLCLVAIKQLYAGLGLVGVLLLAGGGIAYTVGAVIYSLKNVPFMHVVWHLFVMLGAGLMYFSIFLYT